jgi:hypothetical protein
MSNIVRVSILAIIVSAASAAQAEPLGVGARLPDLRLSDQHDVAATIAADDKFVIYSRDMDGGNLVKAALSEQGGKTMAEAKAVYVADIARMPSVITSLFALPSMRKRDYRILLDRDGKATADFPSAQNKVTVMTLDNGVISQIDYLDSPAALRALLKGK